MTNRKRPEPRKRGRGRPRKEGARVKVATRYPAELWAEFTAAVAAIQPATTEGAVLAMLIRQWLDARGR